MTGKEVVEDKLENPNKHTASIYLWFNIKHKVYAVRTTRRPNKNGTFYANSIGYREIRVQWALQFGKPPVAKSRSYSGQNV